MLESVLGKQVCDSYIQKCNELVSYVSTSGIDPDDDPYVNTLLSGFDQNLISQFLVAIKNEASKIPVKLDPVTHLNSIRQASQDFASITQEVHQEAVMSGAMPADVGWGISSRKPKQTARRKSTTSKSNTSSKSSKSKTTTSSTTRNRRKTSATSSLSSTSSLRTRQMEEQVQQLQFQLQQLQQRVNATPVAQQEVKLITAKKKKSDSSLGTLKSIFNLIK